MDSLYQEVTEQEEDEMPIIKRSSDYFIENKLIYQYVKETGLLKLDIDKKDYEQLISNLGDFPDEGVSFCFLLPQMGEVCFTEVKKIERLNERGRSWRLSRIFGRRRR